MNALRRVIAILSLLSAVTSVLFVGKSYVFCPWMERAAAKCCCAHERVASNVPAASPAPCCDRKTIAAAPSAPTDLSRLAVDVPPATAFAGKLVRALDRFLPETDASAPRAREHGARAGPPAPLFELHSVYLI